MLRRSLVVVILLASEAALAGDAYVYSPIGKRDPFRAPPAPVRVDPPCKKGTCRFPLDDFAVQAVVNESGARLAMLGAPDGAGYIVRVGDTVGKERARVTRISSQGVEFNAASAGEPARLTTLPLGHEPTEQPEDLSR
jgi:Tfp pilus assembly protein PilP